MVEFKCKSSLSYPVYPAHNIEFKHKICLNVNRANPLFYGKKVLLLFFFGIFMVKK